MSWVEIQQQERSWQAYREASTRAFLLLSILGTGLPSKKCFAKYKVMLLRFLFWMPGPYLVTSFFLWSKSRTCEFSVLWTDHPRLSLMRQLIEEG